MPPEVLPILIASFSNNGKSAVNQVLRQHNFPTLYIDMNQMDDTSLTLPDLALYLELLFQLSRQHFIFFDNLDSVCYKIESGDLHRRQERIAARLILRLILRLSKQYRKLCVFTAKN